MFAQKVGGGEGQSIGALAELAPTSLTAYNGLKQSESGEARPASNSRNLDVWWGSRGSWEGAHGTL